MNNHGQFLIYDALLALLILLIFCIGVVYVVNQDLVVGDVSSSDNLLDLLSGTDVYGKSLLLSLSDGDEGSVGLANDILMGYDFSLRDLTLNRTLLENVSGNYRTCISSKKVVNGHFYELRVYS